MAHILIVEDENATAWALAESLREEGYETRHAASAEDALAAVRAHATDLVITDLRLPGMSGAQLARRLRSGRRRVPVIVVTAYDSQETLEELRVAGVHAVFPKPFRVDQIRRSVREALDAVVRAAESRAPRVGPRSGR
jgi:two-component system response regulator (stage 0 sporulation protein F)